MRCLDRPGVRLAGRSRAEARLEDGRRPGERLVREASAPIPRAARAAGPGRADGRRERQPGWYGTCSEAAPRAHSRRSPMAKFVVLGLLACLAGIAYWYFRYGKSEDIYEYADTARERATEAFDSASKIASETASRVSNQFERAADTVHS